MSQAATLAARGAVAGDAAARESTRREDSAELGMWIFLAGEVLFFGALFVAYAVARMHHPAGFAAASARTDVWLGTLNTAVLLSSSLAVAIGAEAARQLQPRDAAPWLWAAAALGIVFLAIKGIEYRKEWNEGLFPGADFRIDGREVAGAELFFAWYFLVTALHALHLGIGILLCIGFAIASPSAAAPKVDGTRVHVVALYWHFVDVVWIFLYPLIYLVAPRS